jgi:crotonobetainyl-CoA:carnitine CoA-transferase CaiB-like acyl-CoA transferase
LQNEVITMSDSRAFLSGVKVLDVGTFIFGPAAATVMSDFGADVIKIEPPGIGDPYRYLSKMPPLPACEQDYCWTATSRNKRSVALDLKKDEGRDVLLKLVGKADVLVTNFPPAVLERLRLTYADLKTVNPRLVYAYATGYGERGDEAGKPGYDATAWWARSGLMDAVRQSDADPGLSMPGMGDYPSAMTLFGAIMMALFERERSGQGSKVTSSLVANGVWSNSVFVQAVLCKADPFKRITRRQTPNAVVNMYKCKDERWMFLVMIREDKDWERFADCIGRSDLKADERFANQPHRRENAAALIEVLDGVFASKDYEEWHRVLSAAGITFGPISQTVDIPDDAQLNANGVLVEIDAPEGGGPRTVDSPIWIEGYEKAAPKPAPEIGEHTEEVLTALGYDAAMIASLRACGAIPSES